MRGRCRASGCDGWARSAAGSAPGPVRSPTARRCPPTPNGVAWQWSRSWRTWFVDQLRDFDRRTGAFGQDFVYFSTDEGPTWEGMPVPQVCYDIDFLTRRWALLVDIVSVTEEAYGYQTGVLFRRA